MDDRIMITIRGAVLDAIAVVLPVDCSGCGRVDRALCADCRAAIRPRPERRRLARDLEVVSAVRYEGVAQRALLDFKQADRTELAGALAPSLAASFRFVVGEFPDAAGADVCPVPSSRASFRRRGYDPVRVLLRRAGLPAPRLLRAARSGARQKSLGVEARAANVKGTLVSRRRSLDGRRFVLVDDVVTSGATLVEAARAVRAAGGVVVCAVALASTPKRRGNAPLLGGDRQ